MLVGLFVLLFSILGGSDSPFVIPKIEKTVMKVIVDKERKSEVKALFKEFNKEWKSLRKMRKKQAKQLKKNIKNYSTENKMLAEIASTSATQRSDINDKLVELRLSIQELITSEEWKKIIDGIEGTKPKKIKKQEKANLKTKVKQNKKLKSIYSEIDAAFENAEDKAKANKYFHQFEDDMTNVLFEYQDYPNKLIEVMYNGDASKEDITAIMKILEDYQGKAQNAFLDLHSKLSKLSTENNWSKIAKALNKFIDK